MTSPFLFPGIHGAAKSGNGVEIIGLGVIDVSVNGVGIIGQIGVIDGGPDGITLGGIIIGSFGPLAFIMSWTIFPPYITYFAAGDCAQAIPIKAKAATVKMNLFIIITFRDFTKYSFRKIISNP